MDAPTKSIWPDFSEEEADAAADIVRSNKVNYWTGQVGRAFEREFAEWAGTGHAIALANGTLALDVALKALKIGEGDEVIVTPRTFIASISCIVNAGAVPVFADVDRDSGNISPATITPCVTDRTRAIIAVHLAGWPCDMDGIMALAATHGLAVVEDCAQAHGARIGHRPVGGLGDIGAWSFCQDKIMTTGGEGGMVTTDDDALWSTMWSYKDHGKSWEAIYDRPHPPGFRWVHESFGTNWRMLEMQAAIGRIQLGRLPAWTERRTEIAGLLRDALACHDSVVRAPVPGAGMTHAFYRFYGYVKPEGLAGAWSRDRIVDELGTRGVQVLHGTCSEVYLEKAFDGTPFRPAERLPIARELGETSLMFLTHPTMGEAELERAVAAIHTVLTQAAA